ncbi:HNH endonuclease [Demequina sp.]|uniref:HNH endonuclease n=1 Tax=Demequina sp. TaxID=2050685 RepID=UPI0025BE27F2|nr:HNH endonuclease [Demequina sp.]
MATRIDGTEIEHSEAVDAWAEVAYEELKRVARTYNRVIRYTDLRDVVQETTGISTRMLMQHWIGNVLEIAARKAADAEEPPLTSLCVRTDGTIGGGYDRAPKFAHASAEKDIESRAAGDRLLCYRTYATDMPVGGGTVTLTPEVQIRRREAEDLSWLHELIQSGTLSVGDRVPFHDHLEVARLFGRDYKGHQRATIRLDDFTEIWFPKMYPNDDWDNSLSSDGKTIVMRHVDDGRYRNVLETEPIRHYVITFGQMKPSSGGRYYDFLGVFEGAPHLSDSTRWVYQRVSDTVRFDGDGDFSFDPIRSQPLQDDQTAETADSDPRLVARYQEELEAGRYAVEDEVGVSKVRGSSQQVFAKAVKDNYQWECAVTGIRTKAFLVASHIVPWAADTEIRLDPSNGICLSTFVDRAFDSGYLTITPEGRTAVRWDKVTDDPILRSELSRIDDIELAKPTSCPPDPAKLLRRQQLGY